MDKLNCVIVDDEPLAIEGMLHYLSKIDYIRVVNTFNSPRNLEIFIEGNCIDLVFLDIEMPYESGLSFLKTTKTKAMFILSTAYSEHALEAFELNVTDYLLKPFRFERFLQATNKAYEFWKSKNNFLEAENYFFVKADRALEKIYFANVLYISGLKDYVIIYTIDKKIITYMNMKTIYEKLPKEKFSRISKSFIVNVNYITQINSNSVRLKDKEIPIGKSYKEAFINTHVANKMLFHK